MNYAEERILFNSELGKAIAQWGHVEGQLLRLVKRCTRQSGNCVAEAYLSIENFRSKLSFCDQLMTGEPREKAILQYWAKIHTNCSSLARKRNQLAHGWHALYLHQPVGKRFGIAPVIGRDGRLVHRDGEKAPQGTIYLRDIVHQKQEFRALTGQLCNVGELLDGNPKPYPEDDNPVLQAPTIRMLENRLRVELGRKPRPSGSESNKEHLSPNHLAPPSADDDENDA